jgi:hypothetical protein
VSLAELTEREGERMRGVSTRRGHHLAVTLMMATHPLRRWRQHGESHRTFSLRPPPQLRSAASFVGPMAQILREAVPQNHQASR